MAESKGDNHVPLVPESGWSLLLLWWGAEFPTEILGQFANGHRLEYGMPQDPLPPLSDDPWAGWG